MEKDSYGKSVYTVCIDTITNDKMMSCNTDCREVARLEESLQVNAWGQKCGRSVWSHISHQTGNECSLSF